jgi:1,6-anhydro-N-acetylmuramate kinase
MSEPFICLVSDNSMDGIDAALADFSQRGLQHVARHGHLYPGELKQEPDRALALPDPGTEDLGKLDDAVGEVFAEAANELLANSAMTADAVMARPYSMRLRHPSPTHCRLAIRRWSQHVT